MQCKNPVTLNVQRKANNPWTPQGLKVPCGKCFLCRKMKSKEWALRLYHELETNPDASFVTLTYDEKNLPLNGSLLKSDLQKYFKRLRKDLGKKKVKYFAVGEYGDQFERPHYHAIIYNLHPYKDADVIKENWNKGIVHIGVATPQSIQYVTQYVLKKFSELEEELVYVEQGKQNLFKICSAGIGLTYAINNRDTITSNGYVRLLDKELNIPRYYVKKLGIEIPESRMQKITELDITEVKRYTGLEKTSDDLYEYGMTNDVIKHDDKVKQNRDQKIKTLKAKQALKPQKF